MWVGLKGLSSARLSSAPVATFDRATFISLPSIAMLLYYCAKIPILIVMSIWIMHSRENNFTLFLPHAFHNDFWVSFSSFSTASVFFCYSPEKRNFFFFCSVCITLRSIESPKFESQVIDLTNWFLTTSFQNKCVLKFWMNYFLLNFRDACPMRVYMRGICAKLGEWTFNSPGSLFNWQFSLTVFPFLLLLKS